VSERPNPTSAAKPPAVILNPASNKGKTRKHLSKLLAAVAVQNPSAQVTLTTQSGHAAELSAASSSTRIVACGGDGTINEIIQSLAGTNKTLSVLPCGSGNDFVKNLIIGKTMAEQLHIAFEGNVFEVDAGQLAYGERESRYFINTLGIGFTGRVADAALQVKWLKGFFVYLYAVLKVLVGYQATRMQIDIETESGTATFDEKIFMLTCGNGFCEGGGFLVTPHARIDDGLLDVCLIKDVGFFTVLALLPQVMRGKHLRHKSVFYAKATRIRVRLFKPETAHLDGEIILLPNGELNITVKQKAVRVVARSLSYSNPQP
jgi:diacylglycerol kinase (ATP)